MNDLRIALFTGNYNHIRDGVSLTLNRLVKFLEDHDVPVLIFGPSIKKPPIEHNGELVVTPSIPMLVPGRSEYRIATNFPKWAQKKLKEFNPTLIHIATPDGLGGGALNWGEKNKIPVVSSYHTHFLSYAKYYSFFLMPIHNWAKRRMQKFYAKVEQVYVPSQSMIEELENEGVFGDMRIWARGIDLELFNPSKRDISWRRSIGFEDDEIVVSFVSRLVWEKELGTFIKTVKNLKKINPKVRALVVGDGPVQTEAQKLLPQAYFTGFAQDKDLSRAYASSDIFLFPSHTETFGNVTLEAMASGLPCIVADAIGSKSLVSNGENGYWAEKENESDFTEKLKLMIENPARRKEMGLKSRELALEYKWDVINQGLLKNYVEAVSNYKK